MHQDDLLGLVLLPSLWFQSFLPVFMILSSPLTVFCFSSHFNQRYFVQNLFSPLLHVHISFFTAAYKP